MAELFGFRGRLVITILFIIVCAVGAILAAPIYLVMPGGALIYATISVVISILLVVWTARARNGTA